MFPCLDSTVCVCGVGLANVNVNVWLCARSGEWDMDYGVTLWHLYTGSDGAVIQYGDQAAGRLWLVECGSPMVIVLPWMPCVLWLIGPCHNVFPHIATFPSSVPSLPNSQRKGTQYTYCISYIIHITPLLGYLVAKLAITRRFYCYNKCTIVTTSPLLVVLWQCGNVRARWGYSWPGISCAVWGPGTGINI